MHLPKEHRNSFFLHLIQTFHLSVCAIYTYVSIFLLPSPCPPPPPKKKKGIKKSILSPETTHKQNKPANKIRSIPAAGFSLDLGLLLNLKWDWDKSKWNPSRMATITLKGKPKRNTFIQPPKIKTKKGASSFNNHKPKQKRSMFIHQPQIQTKKEHVHSPTTNQNFFQFCLWTLPAKLFLKYFDSLFFLFVTWSEILCCAVCLEQPPLPS